MLETDNVEIKVLANACQLRLALILPDETELRHTIIVLCVLVVQIIFVFFHVRALVNVHLTLNGAYCEELVSYYAIRLNCANAHIEIAKTHAIILTGLFGKLVQPNYALVRSADNEAQGVNFTDCADVFKLMQALMAAFCRL